MTYGKLAIQGSALNPSLGTAQSFAGQTSRTFSLTATGIQRLTIGLNQLTGGGTNSVIVRLGSSSGIVNSGYLLKGIVWTLSGGSINRSFSSDTTGFVLVNPGVSGFVHSGILVASLVDADNFIYDFSGQWGESTSPAGVGRIGETTGRITLPSELTQFQVSTIAGTDVFAAGTVGFFTE